MSETARGKLFERALRIAGHNWPLYAVAAVAAGIGVALVCFSSVPAQIRWLGGVGATMACWFTCASFWAFHSMFDRSELLSGRWLTEEISKQPNRWVQINAGLEETTLPLHQIFSGAEGKTFDLYNPTVLTEPAITRARQQNVEVTAVAIQPESLPVDDAWAEAVVVMLVAHEIRNNGRREHFFAELKRIVAQDGRVIVVEHLRDLAAALAFGPGLLHFFPRAEWLRLGRRVGLEVERERRITPFVRVFIYRRSYSSPSPWPEKIQ